MSRLLAALLLVPVGTVLVLVLHALLGAEPSLKRAWRGFAVMASLALAAFVLVVAAERWSYALALLGLCSGLLLVVSVVLLVHGRDS